MYKVSVIIINLHLKLITITDNIYYYIQGNVGHCESEQHVCTLC